MPEIACGDFTSILNDLCEAHSAKMLLSIDGRLSASQRHGLVQDFEQGKSHIISTVVLKTSHFQEPPWLVYGVGHPDDGKALRCLDHCLASDCDHHYFLCLRAMPLAQQAQRWLAQGEVPPGSESLEVFIAECRLVPVQRERSKANTQSPIDATETLHTILRPTCLWGCGHMKFERHWRKILGSCLRLVLLCTEPDRLAWRLQLLVFGYIQLL